MHIKNDPVKKIRLMGHVIGNYPSKKDCLEIIATMVEAGVDFIEIQIPFSEPIADGPTFSGANQRAIEKGVQPSHCFELMREVSKKFSIPFLFMTYTNIVFRMGYRNFVKQACEAGAKGAIVPDLPVELADEFVQACKEFNFMNVQVIPPNVSEERLKKLTQTASGMIYAVARHGVTGSKTHFQEQSLETLLKRIRAHRSDLPIAVGFGVRGADDVKALIGKADVAVIGSRSLEVFETGGITAVRDFWLSLARSS